MELAEMRGRVLYAEGRRAQFRQGNGRCIDQDPLDRYAYHVLLRTSDKLIGCIRLVPLKHVQVCGIESLWGRRRFERLLVQLGTTRNRIGEVGRWVVTPEYALLRMGLRLVAGVGTLATWLRLETVVAVAGTRDGQANALMRAGGRPVPGLLPMKSQKYDDDLVILTFDLSHPVNSIGLLAADMALRLSIGQDKEAGEIPTEVPCTM
jgi:hypothetical protein